jgi:hypothetical protein
VSQENARDFTLRLPAKRKWSEKAGIAIGYGLGFLTGAVSFLRRSRMFHPRGIVLRAEVRASGSAVLAALVRGELPKTALVRFSSALWKGREWPDVLGMAIRFTDAERPNEKPAFRDQDLLLATVPTPLLTLVAPLWTRFHDFLANSYYGVSPFELPDGRRVYFRVRFEIARRNIDRSTSRADRLRGALGSRVRLETNPRPVGPGWLPFAELVLREELSIDQEALRFSPFRNGLEIRPRGFVHYLRLGAYAFSQAARPTSR